MAIMSKYRMDIKPVVIEFDSLKHSNYIEQIRDLDGELDQHLTEYDPFPVDTSVEKPQTTEECIKSLTNGGFRLFMILLGDELIGFIHGTPSIYKTALWVNSFVISSEYRHYGYGKLAFKSFEKIVLSEYRHLGLSVHSDNTHAVEFYKRMGFKVFSMSMFK